MGKRLEHVCALFYVIRGIESTLNTNGFTPFAFHNIRNYKNAYVADTEPHDGDSNLVQLAFFASLVQFKHIVPSTNAVTIADAANVRQAAVDIARNDGYEAAPFDTQIGPDVSLNDLMLDMVAAAQGAN